MMRNRSALWNFVVAPAYRGACDKSRRVGINGALEA